MSFESVFQGRYGIKIVTDHNLVNFFQKQVRFPRSRKKRIRKKWRMQSKNYKFWTAPQTTVYKISADTWLMHPDMLRKLKEHIARETTAKIASAAGFRIGEDY